MMERGTSKTREIKDERVYLLRARTLELGPGHTMRYPAGYYHLPPEQAEEWIRDGLAVPESEWEARLAEAEKAAAADPVMHLAGPREAAPAPTLPAGKMWAQGPKDSQKPAVEATTPTVAPDASPPAEVPAGQDSAVASATANQEE